MKTILNLRTMAVVITLSFAFENYCFAQSDWNTHGNIADSSSILGSTNYEDLRIITDSTDRMIISKDGDVEVETNLFVPYGILTTDSIAGVEGNDVNILSNLNVTGTIKADSLDGNSAILKVNSNLNMPDRWIHADSIRVRSIHIGDSSITIGNNPTTGLNTIQASATGGNLEIVSGTGITNFGRYGGTYSNIMLGIGTQTPLARLHLYTDQFNISTGATNPVSELFSNDANNTLGFEVGMHGSGGSGVGGEGFLSNHDNFPISFYTNNTVRRMTILGGNSTTGGFVGINMNTPLQRLDVFDASNPQLRLTENTTGPVFTDFQTTASGNLIINTYTNTTNGFVGIGEELVPSTYEPDATLVLQNQDGNTDPQMRLAWDKDNRASFKVYSNGNLGILPFHNNYLPANQRGVSIQSHTFDVPNFKLHVYGNFGVEDMDPATTPITLWPVVWDEDSHQLQRGISPIGAGLVTPCTSYGGAADDYYLTKWINNGTPQICKSQVYDQGTGGGVCIGTNSPDALLNLVSNISNNWASSNNGLYIFQDGGVYANGGISGASIRAVSSITTTPSVSGVIVSASGANGAGTNVGGNFGILASASGSNTSSVYNYGGYFESYQNAFANNIEYGIYATAYSNNSSSCAGYFAGNVLSTGQFIPISDSTFKDSIYPLFNSLALINQLQPKTFEFDTANYNFMNLPNGKQYGLISQEVEPIIPELIKNGVFPARYDTSGSELNPQVDYLGLNYTGLIPILIGAVKEIDSTLTSRPNKTQNAIWIDTLNQYEWGTTTLKHNTEIPMIDDSLNEWNIYFTGQSEMNNFKPADIGIGYDTSTTLTAKIDVLNTTFSANDFDFVNQYAGQFYTTGTYDVASGNADFAGVRGNSDVTSEDRPTNMGGDFTASNGAYDIGVRGTALDDSLENYGVVADAENSPITFGVHSTSIGTDASVGVYGYATGGASYNYAIQGIVSPVSGATNYAGYFDGDVYTTGSYLPSDAFLKQNIQEVSNTNAMELINALNPTSYNYDTAQFSSMNLPQGMHFGLISEQVEQVLPNLVKQAIHPASTDTLGNVTMPAINFKALNYTEIIPLLIAGIQEMDSVNTAQQLQNQLLQSQLNTLQQQVQQLLNCCQVNPNPPMFQNKPDDQNGNNNRKQQIIELSNYTIILDQNSPNPFAEQTSITFQIPVDIKDAKILFSDDKGVVFKTVQINSRGAGSLLVYASNLSSGIYTYSLLADGKLIDTKKMVCQRR